MPAGPATGGRSCCRPSRAASSAWRSHRRERCRAKSPWTSVSGRPHSSTAARRIGRSCTKRASVARVSGVSWSAVRSTTSAIAAERNGGRQSGSPSAVSSSARPAQARWIATSPSTIRRSSGPSRRTVVARDVRHQDPWPITAKQHRDRAAGQRTQDGPFVREERRHDLQPGRARGRWQHPDAGQVPRPDLHGSPVRCRPAAVSARSAQARSAAGPPTLAHDIRSGCSSRVPVQGWSEGRPRPGRPAPPPPDTSRDRRGTCQAPWREAATRSARSRIAPGTHRSAGPCPATTASPPGRQGAARRRPRPSRR